MLIQLPLRCNASDERTRTGPVGKRAVVEDASRREAVRVRLGRRKGIAQGPDTKPQYSQIALESWGSSSRAEVQEVLVIIANQEDDWDETHKYFSKVWLQEVNQKYKAKG